MKGQFSPGQRERITLETYGDKGIEKTPFNLNGRVPRTPEERAHRGKCVDGLQTKLQAALKDHDLIRAELPHFSKDQKEDSLWVDVALQGQEMIHIAQEMLGKDLGMLKLKDERVIERAVQTLDGLLDKAEEVFNLVK